jgi:hypothetical protein
MVRLFYAKKGVLLGNLQVAFLEKAYFSCNTNKLIKTRTETQCI